MNKSNGLVLTVCRHTYSYQGHSLLPTMGVFAKVIKGGTIRKGMKTQIHILARK